MFWCSVARAAVIPWSGGTGNWDTGTNWTGSVEPGSGDTAQITSFVTVTVNSSGNTVSSLLVSNHTSGPTLTMTGASSVLTVNNDFNLANSATNGQDGNYTQVDGTLNVLGNWNVANVNNASATVDIQGGTVNVTGNVYLSTAGNPQNVSFTTIAAGATINATTIYVGDKAAIGGEGTINADVVVDPGGTVGGELTVVSDDWTLGNNTTKEATLHNGTPPFFDSITVNDVLTLASAGTWTLSLIDDSGFDDVGVSGTEEFTLWEDFDTLTFGATTVTTGSGTITNVTISSGAGGPPAGQIAGASLKYRFNAPGMGEVYLTGVIPLPGPVMLFGVASLFWFGRRRPIGPVSA